MLPASAGMILYLDSALVYLDCAPRICGDDPSCIDESLNKNVCSPHPRG